MGKTAEEVVALVEEVDTGTPAPASEPAEPEKSELSSDESVWAELAADDDDESVAEPEPPEPEAAVQEPEPVEEVAASEPEPEPLTTPTPTTPLEPQAAAPEVPVTPEVTPEPPLTTLTPEQQAFQKQQQDWLAAQQAQTEGAQRSARRQQALDSLAQSYTLDENTIQAYDTNPIEAIPMMAAHLHLRVLEQVIPAVLQMIPAQIAQHSQQRAASTNDEDGFHAAYPKLKEFQPQVKQFAEVWRGLNPTVGYAESVKAIGDHMMVLLGLNESEVPPPPPPPPTPAHVPAAGGAPRDPGQKPAAKSEWDEFVDDVIRDSDE